MYTALRSVQIDATSIVCAVSSTVNYTVCISPMYCSMWCLRRVRLLNYMIYKGSILG